MSFPTRSLNTGSSTPVSTPYQRASQVWDDRIGSARVQARNWRLAAFGSLAVAFLATGGFIVKSMESHYRVFIVPVNEAGAPGRLVLADDNYTISTAEKGYFIKEWLGDMFSHPTDPVVLANNIRDAYSRLSGPAAQTIAAWGQANDPARAPVGFARTVEVQSILPKSDASYQAEWIEHTFDNGVPTTSTHYTGLFTVVTKPPTNQVELLNNPLGLHITSIVWTRS